MDRPLRQGLRRVGYTQSTIGDFAAWQNLFAHPQLWPALALGFGTGVAATLISFLLANLIAASLYFRGRLAKSIGPLGVMLAIPHLALAIALGFLVMPTGLIARIMANVLQWQTPPNWITTHDPYGVLLTIALVLKETPFILYILSNYFQREDVAQTFVRQTAAAHSLGHGDNSIWWRVFLPQAMPALLWPLAIVFIYAASVVDVALAIGPTEPPTLATIIWTDINSADVLNNARGGAGAWFLTALIVGVLVLVALIAHILRPLWRRFVTKGTSSGLWPPSPLRGEGQALTLVENFTLLHVVEKVPEGRMRSLPFNAITSSYILLTFTLALLSIARSWPFPNLIPQSIDLSSWATALNSPWPFINSCALALSTSLSSLLILLLWFEARPKAQDYLLRAIAVVTLSLPALLLGLSQYQVLLRFNLIGQWTGIYLVHLMPVFAYMFIVLSGPYRAFDARWRTTANALRASPMTFILRVKLPLLKRTILASLAIGFAVSFAQYIPAQLASAGRYSTLPIEAVTLTSGANRPLTATYALLLATAPLIVFLLANRLSRSRWRTP